MALEKKLNFIIIYMSLAIGIFAKAIHTKDNNCGVNSDGRKTFYYKFVEDDEACPPTLAGCEGIGVNSTRICKMCCFPPTVSPTQMVAQNASLCKKQDDLVGWTIALVVIVIIETLVVILIGIIGLLAYKFEYVMFFANTRAATQERPSDYTSVALNDSVSTEGEKPGSQSSLQSLDDNQSVIQLNVCDETTL